MAKGHEPRPRFLREWRKYRNLTQSQLAERAEVTQGMISQLELGNSDYTGGLLEALAYALLCEPVDLLIRNPLDPDAPWSIWDGLKPAQRKRAIHELRKIADEDAA